MITKIDMLKCRHVFLSSQILIKKKLKYFTLREVNRIFMVLGTFNSKHYSLFKNIFRWVYIFSKQEK